MCSNFIDYSKFDRQPNQGDLYEHVSLGPFCWPNVNSSFKVILIASILKFLKFAL